MFEFFFKYPATVFAKGSIVFLSRWPLSILLLLMLAAAAALAYSIWLRHRGTGSRIAGLRAAGIWLLQTLLVSLVLLMLWHPAVSIATLRPQQNVVAVLVDSSRSMALKEDGETREQQALNALQSQLLGDLKKSFQVRLYHFDSSAERIEDLNNVQPTGNATRIGSSLRQVMSEASSLPVGAMVVMSDGGDTTGGIDLDTMQEIRRRRIPVHTVGLGREQFDHDIELQNVDMPATTLSDSRVNILVTFSQHGYRGEKAKLIVRENGKALASQDITLQGDGNRQSATVVINGGAPGARNLTVSIDPFPNEENQANNAMTRVLTVDGSHPRILYVEGEPRWEYKFLRRAVEDDKALQLTSMLRTTQNKIYRQNLQNPKELEDGFPVKVDDLFAYDGIIIGSVEANYFTPEQQTLIQQFVDRRGGGVMWLGGRFGLSDGGWEKSPLADLLPVSLPAKENTFQRDEATAELAPGGRESLICRLEDSPDKNAERWNRMPRLANFQEVGNPKAGATVLLNYVTGAGRRSPLLVTENYGRGRTALLATAGTWRWKMQQEHTDRTDEAFWRQMLRWLVTGTPGRVTGSTPQSLIADRSELPIEATVRDKNFMPVSDATVSARILGPDGVSANVALQPEALTEGAYSTVWTTPKPGAYLVEVSAKRGEENVGSETFTAIRQDGVAENFNATQNRELLEKLSYQTGGRYYRLNQVRDLAKEITYSEAGMTVRENRDLWDMPAIFLLAILLRSSEWLLRRRWGVV